MRIVKVAAECVVSVLFTLAAVAVFTLLLATIFGELASGQESKTYAPPPRRPPCFLQLQNIHLHDGDTFHADIVLPWGIVWQQQNIRTDYDTWEINAVRQENKSFRRHPEEFARGAEALAALQLLINQSAGVYITPVYDQRGRQVGSAAYSRLEGHLWVQDARGQMIDVEPWLHKRGHLRFNP